MGSAILLKIIRQQFEGFLGIFFILINRILSFSQIAGFALIVFAWFVLKEIFPCLSQNLFFIQTENLCQAIFLDKPKCHRQHRTFINPKDRKPRFLFRKWTLVYTFCRF